MFRRFPPQVTFRVYCETSYGQTVHVVGDTPALGNWVPDETNKLKWSELNWWETESLIVLHNKQVEYKFVIKDQSGALQWEQGENRIFFTNEIRAQVVEAFGRRQQQYCHKNSLQIKVIIKII